MAGPIVATGDRVVLRTFERDDLRFYRRSCTDPAIRYPLGTDTPKSEDELESRLDERGNEGNSDGFAEEGRAREVRFVEGEYRDSVQYGVLRGEWTARE